MDNIYLKTFFDFIHVIATIMWFGTMFANFVLVTPVATNVLEGAKLHEFMGRLIKKTKMVVYVSFVLLFITGIPMKIANDNYVSIINFSNNWQIILLIKHVFVALLGLLALYNFELYPRLVKKAGLNSSSSKLDKLKNTRAFIGKLSISFALIIILLSAVMKYIS